MTEAGWYHCLPHLAQLMQTVGACLDAPGAASCLEPDLVDPLQVPK